MITTETTGNLDQLIDFGKQLRFATAKTLTQVAKRAQAKAIEKIKAQVHPRAAWYLPSNRFGVRITPARPDSLTAEVKSDAYWLAALDQAQRHTAEAGHMLIVPTDVLRRLLGDKNRPQRPGVFAKTFIIKTEAGLELLCKRTGATIVVLAVLKQSVPRPQKTPLTSAVIETFEKEFAPTFAQNLADAIATAR